MSDPEDPSSTSADRRAIERALAREPGGATFLHGKYARLVRAVLRRFVKDDATVEDISQEAFARAFQGLAQLKDATKLKAWLAVIAERAFLKYRRDVAPPVEEPLEPEAFADPAQDMEALIRDHDVRSQVEELAEPYRTTLLQRYWDDLPLPEVARRQGIQLSLAKYRAQQGLRLLRARLMLDGIQRPEP